MKHSGHGMETSDNRRNWKGGTGVSCVLPWRKCWPMWSWNNNLYYNFPSVVVRKLQVAILARSPREIYQTDRIV